MPSNNSAESPESPRLFVDTGILLGLTRGGEFSRRLLSQFPLLTMSKPPLVCYVSVAEVMVIAKHREWGRAKREQLNFFLSLFPVFHIDEPGVLDAYVELDVSCRSKGIDMGKNDLWIAACVNVAGAILLTTDKDFDRVDPANLMHRFIDPHDVKADN